MFFYWGGQLSVIIKGALSPNYMGDFTSNANHKLLCFKTELFLKALKNSSQNRMYDWAKKAYKLVSSFLAYDINSKELFFLKQPNPMCVSSAVSPIVFHWVDFQVTAHRVAT